MSPKTTIESIIKALFVFLHYLMTRTNEKHPSFRFLHLPCFSQEKWWYALLLMTTSPCPPRTGCVFSLDKGTPSSVQEANTASISAAACRLAAGGKVALSTKVDSAEEDTQTQRNDPNSIPPHVTLGGRWQDDGRQTIGEKLRQGMMEGEPHPKELRGKSKLFTMDRRGSNKRKLDRDATELLWWDRKIKNPSTRRGLLGNPGRGIRVR